jgi:hypothetical protein
MPRRSLLGLLALIAALIVSAGVFAGPGTMLAEQPVRNGSMKERYPAAEFNARGVDNLVWTESPNRQPGRGEVRAFFRKGTNTKIKLNTQGWGYTGGVDPPWVVYQQVVGDQSSIKLYRIDTRKRSNPPKGVNTANFEYSPTISGKWLLFARGSVDSNLQRIILFNRSNRQSRVLATVNGENINLLPGQVNGRWAVWTTCTSSACDVFRYDSTTRTKTKLPKPAGPTFVAQYGASVLPNGVIYAARSGEECGDTVRIIRFRSDDPATGTEIASLPAERDLSYGFARKRPNGSVDYLYDRRNCETLAGDIYRVNDPPAP